MSNENSIVSVKNETVLLVLKAQENYLHTLKINSVDKASTEFVSELITFEYCTLKHASVYSIEDSQQVIQLQQKAIKQGHKNCTIKKLIIQESDFIS